MSSHELFQQYEHKTLSELQLTVRNMLQRVHSGFYNSNFKCIFVLPEQDGIQNIVAVLSRLHTQNDEGGMKIVVIQVNHQNEIVGYAISFTSDSDQTPLYKNQPFVEYTHTSATSRRKGLGIGRLLVLNAVAREHGMNPLRSSTLIQIEAEKAWQKLVSLELAEVIYPEHGDIYRFRS